MLVRLWRKGILVHCWWGCKLEQPLWKTVKRFLKKLNIKLTSHNFTPGYLPKENENTNSNDNASLFIEAFFTTAKIWEHPKYPLIDEWIKNMWYIYIDNRILLSNKENDILPLATIWMDLESLMLCEISQSEKGTNYFN